MAIFINTTCVIFLRNCVDENYYDPDTGMKGRDALKNDFIDERLYGRNIDEYLYSIGARYYDDLPEPSFFMERGLDRSSFVYADRSDERKNTSDWLIKGCNTYAWHKEQDEYMRHFIPIIQKFRAENNIWINGVKFYQDFLKTMNKAEILSKLRITAEVRTSLYRTENSPKYPKDNTWIIERCIDLVNENIKE